MLTATRIFRGKYGFRCKNRSTEEEEDASSSASLQDSPVLLSSQNGVGRTHAHQMMPSEMIEELNDDDGLLLPPPGKKKSPLPDNVNVQYLQSLLQKAQGVLERDEARLEGILAELAKLRADASARTEAIKQRKDEIINIEHAIACISKVDSDAWEYE